jgi:ribosomal protein S18 acetylase RimI-like enzyme
MKEERSHPSVEPTCNTNPLYAAHLEHRTYDMLRSATLSDLRHVVSWVPTARDCELWAGRRVSFPIDWTSLPAAIDFTESNAFSLIDGEELVAFGQLVRKSPDRGHLARLVVKPELRGKGHGETLVRALLDRARIESFERVSLNVHSANLPAISLYLKMGFTDAGRPPDEPESAGARYLEMSHRREKPAV